MTRRLLPLCPVALFVTAIMTVNALGQPDIEIIALSGEEAPGTTAGTTFDSFSAVDLHFPPMDRQGRSAIVARTRDLMDNTGFGIWRHAGGHLTPVAISGEPAPGTPEGTIFSRFSFVRLDIHPSIGDGRVLFRALLDGPDIDLSNLMGAWAAPPDGPPVKLLREGDPAPGHDAGVTVQDFLLQRMSASGDVFATARVTGPGFDDANDDGLWTDRGGPFRKIFAEGDPVPGLAGGIVFGEGSGGAPVPFVVHATGRDGEAVLAVKFSGSVDHLDDEAVMLDTDDDTRIVLREGDEAPGLPGQVVGDPTGVARFGSFSMNDAGELAFIASLREAGGPAAIFIVRGGAPLTAAVRLGDPAPGTSMPFSSLVQSRLDSEGRLYFLGAVGPTPFDYGLWLDESGSATQILSPGVTIPGEPEGTNLVRLTRLIGITHRGTRVLRGLLQEPGDDDPRDVFLRLDRDGALTILAEVRGLFDLRGDGSDVRTINSMVADWLTPEGHLAVEIDFLDGSTGRFVFRVDGALFTDGFESGDTGGWSSATTN